MFQQGFYRYGDHTHSYQPQYKRLKMEYYEREEWTSGSGGRRRRRNPNNINSVTPRLQTRYRCPTDGTVEEGFIFDLEATTTENYGSLKIDITVAGETTYTETATGRQPGNLEFFIPLSRVLGNDSDKDVFLYQIIVSDLQSNFSQTFNGTISVSDECGQPPNDTGVFSFFNIEVDCALQRVQIRTLQQAIIDYVTSLGTGNTDNWLITIDTLDQFFVYKDTLLGSQPFNDTFNNMLGFNVGFSTALGEMYNAQNTYPPIYFDITVTDPTTGFSNNQQILFSVNNFCSSPPPNFDALEPGTPSFPVDCAARTTTITLQGFTYDGQTISELVNNLRGNDVRVRVVIQHDKTYDEYHNISEFENGLTISIDRFFETPVGLNLPNATATLTFYDRNSTYITEVSTASGPTVCPTGNCDPSQNIDLLVVQSNKIITRDVNSFTKTFNLDHAFDDQFVIGSYDWEIVEEKFFDASTNTTTVNNMPYFRISSGNNTGNTVEISLIDPNRFIDFGQGNKIILRVQLDVLSTQTDPVLDGYVIREVEIDRTSIELNGVAYETTWVQYTNNTVVNPVDFPNVSDFSTTFSYLTRLGTVLTCEGQSQQHPPGDRATLLVPRSDGTSINYERVITQAGTPVEFRQRYQANGPQEIGAPVYIRLEYINDPNANPPLTTGYFQNQSVLNSSDIHACVQGGTASSSNLCGTRGNEPFPSIPVPPQGSTERVEIEQVDVDITLGRDIGDEEAGSCLVPVNVRPVQGSGPVDGYIINTGTGYTDSRLPGDLPFLVPVKDYTDVTVTAVSNNSTFDLDIVLETYTPPSTGFSFEVIDQTPPSAVARINTEIGVDRSNDQIYTPAQLNDEYYEISEITYILTDPNGVQTTLGPLPHAFGTGILTNDITFTDEPGTWSITQIVQPPCGLPAVTSPPIEFVREVREYEYELEANIVYVPDGNCGRNLTLSTSPATGNGAAFHDPTSVTYEVTFTNTGRVETFGQGTPLTINIAVQDYSYEDFAGPISVIARDSNNVESGPTTAELPLPVAVGGYDWTNFRPIFVGEEFDPQRHARVGVTTAGTRPREQFNWTVDIDDGLPVTIQYRYETPIGVYTFALDNVAEHNLDEPDQILEVEFYFNQSTGDPPGEYNGTSPQSTYDSPTQQTYRINHTGPETDLHGLYQVRQQVTTNCDSPLNRFPEFGWPRGYQLVPPNITDPGWTASLVDNGDGTATLTYDFEVVDESMSSRGSPLALPIGFNDLGQGWRLQDGTFINNLGTDPSDTTRFTPFAAQSGSIIIDSSTLPQQTGDITIQARAHDGENMWGNTVDIVIPYSPQVPPVIEDPGWTVSLVDNGDGTSTLTYDFNVTDENNNLLPNPLGFGDDGDGYLLADGTPFIGSGTYDPYAPTAGTLLLDNASLPVSGFFYFLVRATDDTNLTSNIVEIDIPWIRPNLNTPTLSIDYDPSVDVTQVNADVFHAVTFTPNFNNDLSDIDQVTWSWSPTDPAGDHTLLLPSPPGTTFTNGLETVSEWDPSDPNNSAIWVTDGSPVVVRSPNTGNTRSGAQVDATQGPYTLTLTLSKNGAPDVSASVDFQPVDNPPFLSNQSEVYWETNWDVRESGRDETQVIAWQHRGARFEDDLQGVNISNFFRWEDVNNNPSTIAPSPPLANQTDPKNSWDLDDYGSRFPVGMITSGPRNGGLNTTYNTVLYSRDRGMNFVESPLIPVNFNDAPPPPPRQNELEIPFVGNANRYNVSFRPRQSYPNIFPGEPDYNDIVIVDVRFDQQEYYDSTIHRWGGGSFPENNRGLYQNSISWTNTPNPFTITGDSRWDISDTSNIRDANASRWNIRGLQSGVTGIHQITWRHFNENTYEFQLFTVDINFDDAPP